MPLAHLELVCFGAPLARVAGVAPPREVQWRKHFGLLVYLALSPSRHRSRDHLVGLFWAEQPERKAKKSLDQALYRLRGALGEERLRSEHDGIALSGDALEVDALRFSSQVKGAPDDALHLLRGDFLEGFHVDDAPEFEDWMGRERQRYRSLATAALVAAGERRLVENRLAEAADAARRALALEPRLEPGVRLLMRALWLADDAATALAAFQEFASRLKTELNEQPSRSLVGLAERIRVVGSRRQELAAAAAPLVGREQVHHNAFEIVGKGLLGGAGTPRALVITSPPGMGRSRLLAECVRRGTVNGALIVQTRAVESDHDAPWSALRLLVRAGLADAPGLPAASRASLGALADLVPELADRFPARPVRDVSDMGRALADVLGAVASERPVLLALDDAHWADGSSLAALGTALGGAQTSPILLILTLAQGVGDAPRELLRLQSDVGRDIPGLTVRLGALDESDFAALVAQLAPWCRDPADRDRLTRRLAFETAGNPFFAVTLLRSLGNAGTRQTDFVVWPPPRGTHGAPPPFSVPSVVREAIAVRVGELSVEETAVLRAASVCGEVLDAVLIAAVAGVPVTTVERALPTFERRQLVQFDGTRYAFAAPLIADVVRTECLTRGERRALEARASEALATRQDLESRARRVELLAHIAPDAASYDLAITVARAALDGGARRTAQRVLAAADRVSTAAQLDRRALEELRRRL